MSRAQIIEQDPGRAPLFYRDLRDVGFFFKDFIYLFDRDRDSQREREHKQGEWERKKQAPSGGA